MKQCNKCNELKPLDDFYKRKTSLDGYRNDCKVCNLSYHKEHRENNKEEISAQRRRYREENKEEISKRKKAYYDANRDAILERRKPYFDSDIVKERSRVNAIKYYHNNRDSRIKANKEYRENNREKYLENGRLYYRSNKDRFRERNTENMRAWREKNKEKERSARCNRYEKNKERILSLCRDYRNVNRHKLNAYFSKRRADKFKATPSWANEFFIEEAYGLAKLRTELHGFQWHVDHIVPLKSDLVCGLHCDANLQVIPWRDNIVKNNRYWPDMP